MDFFSRDLLLYIALKLIHYTNGYKQYKSF